MKQYTQAAFGFNDNGKLQHVFVLDPISSGPKNMMHLVEVPVRSKTSQCNFLVFNTTTWLCEWDDIYCRSILAISQGTVLFKITAREDGPSSGQKISNYIHI